MEQKQRKDELKRKTLTKRRFRGLGRRLRLYG